MHFSPRAQSQNKKAAATRIIALFSQLSASKRRIFIRFGVSFLAFHAAAADVSVTRVVFTPPVVPSNYSQPVRLEAIITGSPSSVNFEYNGVNRPMYDNGTHGDLVSGDGEWTILLQTADIFNKNTADYVFRPFLGYCKPASGSTHNIFAEMWTEAISFRGIRQLEGGGQETNYIVNYTATTSQLLQFDPRIWTKRFYATHPDDYDFISIVLVGGSGNRMHRTIKNTVSGIGVSQIDLTDDYGSQGHLMGATDFPISSLFDTASPAFLHEAGHQWINHCAGTPFAAGIPHWPKGDVAINVMGISIAGGEGGAFGYTFVPKAQGSSLVQLGNSMNLSTFNLMELYLMGLAGSGEVGTFFVLKNQNQAISPGQTLQASEITSVTVNNVISALGTRIPSSTTSAKNFRCATVVLSEQKLDAYGMAFYDYFARRGESRRQLAYADGFMKGTTNPWYLATGGRSALVTKISDAIPERDDLIGTWSNSGIYSRDSYTGAWTYLSNPASQIAAGDLDDDGLDDLVGVWPGSGTWVKYSATGQWASLGTPADWIALGDINGDKRVDLIGIWDSILWMRNSKTGGWSQISSGASQVAAGDMDGDGKAEVIAVWPGDATWIRQSSNGQWVRAGSAADWIATGDLNGDGKSDLLGIWGNVAYARDSATGQWYSLTTGAKKIATGDLDGDRKSDLIGIWPDGLWVKYSSNGKWESLSSTGDWITAGRLR